MGLLIFLPVFLIPAYASSSLAFHMIYLTYKLNKRHDNIQPWRTPFPIWNLSVPCLVLTVGSNCCFLTCIQISHGAGKVVWYSHLFKNYALFFMIHTVKGLAVINKAEVNVFLELSCFFSDPADTGNFICDSSAFSKSSLNIQKFMIHILLKPGLKNLGHYFASVWFECNCAIVWTFSGVAFLWDWNENWPFPVLQPLLSFPNLLAYWV